jgi:hypothetical protein
MSKYIGRLIKVGIAKETVRGTAVDPSYYLPIMKAEHGDKAEHAMNEAGFGTISDAVGSEVVKVNGEGGFSAYIGDKHFGLILYAMLGTKGVAGYGGLGNDLVYTHTFTLLENALHPSLTLAVVEDIKSQRFALGMLDALEMKFERGKILEYTAGFRSKKGVDQVLTPALPAENIFRPQDFHLYFASAYSGLGAASETPVKMASLKVEKSVEDDDVLGSDTPQDINNKELKITGSITLLYDADTFRQYNLVGTTKAMRMQLANTGVVIGSALNPTMNIDFAKVVFNDYSRDTTLGNLVQQTIGFKAVYSTSDSKVGQATLTNLVASY